MNKEKIKKYYSFSVIVPAFNEEDYITDCLKSLKAQNYPGKIETIVVDNASTDETAEIAKKNGAIVIRENTRRRSKALHTGGQTATGEIIAITDADSIVPPFWISRLNEIYNMDEKIVAAGGFYAFGKVNFIIEVLANKIALNIIELGQRYLISPRIPHMVGPNLSIKKNIYDKFGGYNPQTVIVEDIELSKKAGGYGKVFYDPNLVVKTSFRRYSGGYTHTVPILARAVKEMFFVLSRFISYVFFGKTYAFDQTSIREKSSRKIRKNYHSGIIIIVLIILVIFFYGAFAPWTNIFGTTIYHGNMSSVNQKLVAITFDDGPYGEATDQILDILEEKNVQATFFLVGKNAEKYPDIIQRELNEGHIIGNHSYDHPWLLFLKGSRNIKNNVAKAEQTLSNTSDLRPRFFRPPHGFKSPIMIRSLKKEGYDIILWNDITTDYNANTSPEKITQHILDHAKPGGIIVLHDGAANRIDYPRENIIEALPEIIDGIRARGFEIVPLDQLIGEKAYF